MKNKRWLKRVFRGWVPTEPLKSKHWLKNKTRLLGLSFIIASTVTIGILSLVSSPLTAIPPPIFAGEYDPGVTIGDYVTYGNFVCNRKHPKGHFCINDLEFKKMEVIAISGKEVTFLYTEQFKNGSATMRNGLTSTWDVEKFAWGVDDDELWIDFEQIVAANLTEGNCIVKTSESGYSEWSRDNNLETDVRSYLGSDRNVVIHSWCFTEGVYPGKIALKANTVYDQLSGIRLEVEVLEWDGTEYSELVQGFSVVDTNIFSVSNVSSSWLSEIMAEPPTVALFAITGLIIIATFVVVGVILRKRRFRGGEKDAEK